MTDSIDYDSFDLPDNEQYGEWTYAERRAYVLSEIREEGRPRAVNQAAIARQFHVSRTTINNDVDVLANYVADTLGDRRVMQTAVVLDKAIDGLLEDGEYRKAAQTALEWNEWVAREGELAEIKDQLGDLLEERDRRRGAADRDGDGAGRDDGENAPTGVLEGVTLSLGGDDR